MSAPSECPLSRRDFLKRMGAGAAVATTASLIATPALASDNPSADALGVLIDLTRCTGCNSCALACKEANNRANPKQVPTRLDSNAYTFVDVRNVGEAAEGSQQVSVKRQCMNCLHPACVSACTVGAMRKTPEGPVVYDSKKCIGCRYCQYACPFGVPTYDWSNPLGLIHKCQMCVSRLQEGEKPACTANCPAGALRFGKRSELLAQAHGQIASNPGRYIDHVYGEAEVGGTSMLYLSGVPFAQLGLPTLGSRPISQSAESVMKKTPVIAVTVASLATGLYWLTKRREMNLAETRVEPTEGDRS